MGEKAKEVKESHLPSNLEKAKYYFDNAIQTGAKEALHMGFQQAMGMFLEELVKELIAQAKDIYNNSWKKSLDDTFYETVSIRFKEVAQNIASKWEDIFTAFKNGAVSGMISNIITVAINIFVTTAEKLVKFIREGIMSLVKAIKLIMNPPKNMSVAQVYHEATKIITAGVFIGVGIIVEEKISLYLKPLGIPYHEKITVVLVGIVVSLLTGLTVFVFDKIDLFGAEHENKFNFLVSKLEEMNHSNLDEIESSYEALEIMYKK